MKRYPSGAGGLYSTAGDYARFCQMLLNGGELDGAQILGRKTVELMLANHLGHLSPPVNEFNDGEGFGLGGYVVLDPRAAGSSAPWDSSAGPARLQPGSRSIRRSSSIAILMMQHLPRRLPRDPPRPRQAVQQSRLSGADTLIRLELDRAPPAELERAVSIVNLG